MNDITYILNYNKIRYYSRSTYISLFNTENKPVIFDTEWENLTYFEVGRLLTILLEDLSP